MTRKKSLAGAIVNLPGLVAHTTLESLPVADRDAISPVQAAAIAQLAQNYAMAVARELEKKGPADLVDLAAMDPSRRGGKA